MAAPAVLGYGNPAETNDRILGPVAATFAIVAWWEATRSSRWANLPIGIWLVAAPWILGYEGSAAILNSVLVGLVMAACSLVRGRITQHYGGGWKAAFRSDGGNG